MANTICRAYKTELRPNNVQRTQFVRHCGVARFVYNWALADRIERYKNGESTNHYEQKRRFNALKDQEFPWIRETAYTITDSAFANLDRAYQNFFRRVKQSAEKKGFPKFKSRKRGMGSFQMRGAIRVEPHRIRLPRIGWIRLKEKGYLPTDGVKVLSATISERSGRWFVSLQVQEDAPEYPVPIGKPLGIDLGINKLAVCSNGRVFENPKSLKRYEGKLARLQRELSRRERGGQNYQKTKRKIARLHYRIACLRRTSAHECTHYVIAKAKPSQVVIEDLNVKGMMRNHCLARAVGDASFGEIRRQIEYKAKWHGVEVTTADRWFPSSKICSHCGGKKTVMRLSERRYVCEACGAVVDRDLNAAINLAALAKPSNGRCLPAELGCSNASL